MDYLSVSLGRATKALEEASYLSSIAEDFSL
jgi:hypothetical protein